MPDKSESNEKSPKDAAQTDSNEKIESSRDAATGDDNQLKSNLRNAPIDLSLYIKRESLDQPQNNEKCGQSQRKGSAVNFKDKCELYEVDLSSTINRFSWPNRQHSEKSRFFLSLRFFVILLSLTSPFIVTFSKTIINSAINDMVLPKESNVLESTTVSPASNETIKEVYTVTDAEPTSKSNSFEHDNSCPVDKATRERLMKEGEDDKRKARESVGEKFDWGETKQGLLKGAYAAGHALFQVAGGRYSEIYGSHWIMSISAFLMCICCLAAPILASIGFYFMLIDLVLLGILGSFMSPALITLFSNWLTPSEKSVTMSLYLVSSRLGSSLSTLLCNLLSENRISWTYSFYFAGFSSLLFSIIFVKCVRSRPQDHPNISENELNYLICKNKLVREAIEKEEEVKRRKIDLELKETAIQVESNSNPNWRDSYPVEGSMKPDSAPWFAILTNKPVLAFIIAKLCVKWPGETIEKELQTYLKRVLHVSYQHIGIIGSVAYGIFCISCLLVAGISKYLSKGHTFGLSKTFVRKLFQCSASFSVAIILFVIANNVCNNITTVVFVMLFYFMTTLSTCGEAQIPLDISERYSGTIHALGSSLASIAGAVEPITVGAWLEKNGGSTSKDNWTIVWMTASAIAAFGGVVFLIFGDATLQHFDNAGNISPSTKAEKTNQDGGTMIVTSKGGDNEASETDQSSDNSEPPSYRESSRI